MVGLSALATGCGEAEFEGTGRAVVQTPVPPARNEADAQDPGLDFEPKPRVLADKGEEPEVQVDPEPELETVDDETSAPDVVRRLTGTLKWDGRARFCVNFKTGTIILDGLASRLSRNYAQVMFVLETNGGVETVAYHTSEGNRQLPGNWKFIQSANLEWKNFTSCTDNRRSMPPRISQTNDGQMICVDMNDEEKEQSGAACFDLDWHLN